MSILIVSTVGTSILTNLAIKEEKNLLFEHSNTTEPECTEEVKKIIEQLAETTISKLKNVDEPTARKLSAELNGIYGIMNIYNENDYEHLLVCTDTYQGRKSAQIIREYLEKKGYNCNIFAPKGLTTKNKSSFLNGLQNVVKHFENVLTSYKKNGFEIVFNLTGGFKSIQGYLTLLGMFYADKIVYIFESSQSELIELPKLPINTDISLIRRYKDKFWRLYFDKIKADDFKECPQSFVEKIEVDGTIYFILSVIGKVLFEKAKKELLYELPKLSEVNYSSDFNKIFEEIKSNEEREKVIDAIGSIFKAIINAEDYEQFNKLLEFDVIKDRYYVPGPYSHGYRIYLVKIDEKFAISFNAYKKSVVIEKYGLIKDLENSF